MLNKVIDILCNYTNWKTPHISSENITLFSLENNVELFLFATNTNDIVFYVQLMPLPQENPYQFIYNIAQKSIGMYKIKKSILSISNNFLTLHRTLKNDQINQTNIINLTKEILNDADIWKNILSKEQESSSSFSFPFNNTILP